MSKPRRNPAFLPLDDPLFPVKRRKPVPHEFVLDALAPLAPRTHPMFGCLAIYVGDKVRGGVQDKVQDKIVLILRDKRDQTADNGPVPQVRAGFGANLGSLSAVRRGLSRYPAAWRRSSADARGFFQAQVRVQKADANLGHRSVVEGSTWATGRLLLAG